LEKGSAIDECIFFGLALRWVESFNSFATGMTVDSSQSSRAPTVGIIIPAYKVSGFIGSTVNSLIAQDWPNWEAIIVDDGSPDDLRTPIADQLDSDSRLRYFRKQNGGVSSARNYGFHQVSKEVTYLLFLDGDDMLAPSALRRMVEVLEKNPQAGMVHCDPSFVDEEGRTIPDFEWAPRWAWGPRLLPSDEPVTPFESIYTLAGLIPSLTLIRRTAYELSPGWDEDFGHICEDTDLFLHVALRSEVRYLPERLMLHRRHSGQSTANVSHISRQEEKLYAKWTSMPGLTLEQRELIERSERFRTGPLAARKGFDFARRYLSRGEIVKGLRFLIGALRIKLLGPFCPLLRSRTSRDLIVAAKKRI
jgi:glycosyltransferase involved in cell wall biosynthesis